MRIRKFRNGNINVQLEKNFDKREEYCREGLDELDEFAAILCNSAELDFTTDGVHHMEGMYLYNFNTCGEYLINAQDAQMFFLGASIRLLWMKDENRTEH